MYKEYAITHWKKKPKQECDLYFENMFEVTNTVGAVTKASCVAG